MIQKALWLQASGIPKEMKVTKEDLLFSRWSYLVNTWIVLYISWMIWEPLCAPWGGTHRPLIINLTNIHLRRGRELCCTSQANPAISSARRHASPPHNTLCICFRTADLWGLSGATPEPVQSRRQSLEAALLSTTELDLPRIQHMSARDHHPGLPNPIPIPALYPFLFPILLQGLFSRELTTNRCGLTASSRSHRDGTADVLEKRFLFLIILYCEEEKGFSSYPGPNESLCAVSDSGW